MYYSFVRRDVKTTFAIQILTSMMKEDGNCSSSRPLNSFWSLTVQQVHGQGVFFCLSGSASSWGEKPAALKR